MSGLIYPLNNKEYTAEDVEIFNCTRTSGVYSVLDFDYTLSGYSMTIGKGLAWIKNSDFSGKAIAFKEPEELTFEEPHESLERYDVVAIRFDADTQDAQLVIVKGEPSESPRLPPRSTFAWEYELFLYSILRKPSDYNISSDNITDLREDEAYCGIMRDSVTSGVAPLQEVIVENANLKQGDFIDFDANKYTHLVATVNTNIFSCDVVLSKMRDTFGVGKVGFTGMTSMYPPGASTYNTIFVGAQIEGKTTENIGHHIQQISFSDKPEFVGEDFSGMVSISKIVGVCERPEGYVKVDSLYNAESNNAQSGTAVAKAIEDAVEVASNNAKDLITESVDPHFIGDSERAQSGVAVSEALESKQDRLFAGYNIKTINHETLLGSGDVTIDFSEDIDKTNDKLKRLAESTDLNTLDGWVYRANVSTDGKWENVNAAVLSTCVSIVPTIPGEKLVISRNAFTKNTYFACLTDFKEPVEGESLMLSSDPVLGKVVKPTENEEYTIPSDTKFIVVSVNGTFNKATPSKFVLGGYDYLLSGRANVKALIDNKSDISSNQVLTYADYYDYEIIDNSIMNLAGNVTTASNFANWWVTNHIYCAGMTSIEYQAVTNSASASNIAFFDSTKKFISGQATGTSADVPDGAFYVRFCGHINSKNDFYVKFHSTKTVIERLYEAENTFDISNIPDGSITRQKLAANFMGTGVGVSSGEDANNLLDVGDYLCYSGVLNMPSKATYGLSVRCYKAASNNYIVKQTAIDNVSGDIYERLCQVSKPATEWLYNFTEWKDIINDHSKPLDGKTILLFGDSITVLGNVIANKISETTGAEVINCGFSGCRMARHGTDVYSHYGMAALAEAISANNFTEQENNLANAGAQQTAYTNTLNTLKTIDFSTVDFVSIAYGTNDWNANVPLKNDENEFDPDTFEGALRYALKELYTKNPLLRINVCTPLYRFVWNGGNVTDDSDTKTNTIGLKLTDYITSLENVCAEFHAQVIDLYNETGFNKYTAGAYFPSDDGTHPNIAGRELVGKKIAVEIMHNNGITE
jgi:lysophospholipase L1-like esterase